MARCAFAPKTWRKMHDEPPKLLRECCIDGRLKISSGDIDVFIEADEQRIKVIVPAEISLTSKSLAKHQRFLVDVMSVFHQAFDGMGIRVEGYYGGKHVALLGKGSKPGLISKYIKVGTLQIRTLPLISALIYRNSSRIKKRF